jgi:CDP-glucose 4,6-dehydratase
MTTFWKDKRVLVTGHTGFKGAWLSLWLQQMGAKVTGYALAAPTTPSLFEQARVADGMTSVIADVRDLPRLTEVTRQAQPDVIFHLAAQSLVRASYDDPVGTYGTNVMGTVHVLEAARGVSSVKAIVIVTTDKCYENREWTWGYRENDALGGRDPYSNSKACAELVTQAYRMSFGGAAIASARAGNVIGGGDWAKDRIVPDAMRAFLAGQPLTIRNPASTRPWQHVLEPLAGYLQLAQCLVGDGERFAEAWNFGPPDDLVLPVQQLVDKLVAAWGAGASWQTPGTPGGPHEATLLKLDASKARERLHWKPRLSIEQSLAWIVEWHQTVGRGGDARVITNEQLARYAQLVG